MKRYGYLAIFLLVGILFAGTMASFAQKPMDSPSADVDGKTWLSSTEQEKKAFLFGAGSAIALEYHLRLKRGEEPSRLVKGWVEGLKDMSWADLTNRVDGYYRNNPDKTNRHVFDVIWHETIRPNWKN